MRVLHVINSLETGGAEKMLLSSVPLLVRNGIDVDILCLKKVTTPFKEQLENLNCCKIYELKFGSIYNPVIIFKLLPILREYEVIHAHLFPSFYHIAIAKSFFSLKAKLVCTEHNTSNKRKSRFYYKPLERLAYKQFDRIICVSAEIQQQMSDYLGYSLKRLPVILNGIDLKQIFDAKPISKLEIAPGIMSDDILLIQVSRLTKQKDHETVIRSLSNLPNNVKLLLVGTGYLVDHYKELVRQLDLNGRVFFLGVRSDVFCLLKSSDVIVLSSFSEGLSLSSLEGMASGKPFVASNVPGLDRLVEGAGLLFPVGDDLKLAETIGKVLENQEFNQEVVKNCLRRAKKFDINNSVKETIQIYNSILS